MSTGRATLVATGKDLTGRTFATTVEDDKRYHALDFDDMRDADLDLSISSLWIVAADTPTSLVLFNEYWRPFIGTFIQYTNSSSKSQVANLQSSWDNAATCLLAVRRSDTDRMYSFNNILTLAKGAGVFDIDETIEALSEKAKSGGKVKEVRLVSGPEIWGEFFPTDIDGLSSNTAYVALFLELELDLPTIFYKTYSAGVTIYLSFEISNGDLIGSVAGWEVWVESGGKHDKVELALKEGLDEAAADLNKALLKIGQNWPFDAYEYSEVYLLPGTYDDWHDSSSFAYETGDSIGDVVLVTVDKE